jgi:hypothetical protein
MVGEIYRSKSKLFKEGDRVLAVPTSDNGLARIFNTFGGQVYTPP